MTNSVEYVEGQGSCVEAREKRMLRVEARIESRDDDDKVHRHHYIVDADCIRRRLYSIKVVATTSN